MRRRSVGQKIVTRSVGKEKAQMNDRKHTHSRSRGLIAAIVASAALIAMALAATPASAEFGLNYFDVQFNEQDATPGVPFDDPPATRAGSHPFAVTTYLKFNSHEIEPIPGALFNYVTDERVKNVIAQQVAGLSGDATAIPRCSSVTFSDEQGHKCDLSTQLGVAAVGFGEPDLYVIEPVFNLVPPPGAVARFGFWDLSTVPTIIDIGVKPDGEYNLLANGLELASPVVPVFAAVLQLWGLPADPAHDSVRGGCNSQFFFGSLSELNFEGGGSCPTSAKPRPFLNLPGSCTGPVETRYETDSWMQPDKWLRGGSLSHDNGEPPNPIGFSGCGQLNFNPRIESKPTSDSAESGTGLDVNADFPVSGLRNPDGLLESQAKKVVLTLPEGVSVNPSVAEGLGVCSPADLKRETLQSDPGQGCPNSSKVGTLHLETPLVEEGVDGSVYLAQQDDPGTTEPGAENPFDSLIALYLVLKNPNLGVLVKQAIKVEPDPETGQLTATLNDIPQIPFSHFNFHFREGQRAPLVTPSACGTYTTEAKLYPWSDPSNPRTLLSDFEITRGVGGGPCPSGGVPPFHPGLTAGTLNNAAGRYSPFNVRLSRNDGEQEFTHFSIKLPPGLTGKLAGIPFCSDAAIAVAKARTGPHGGARELASPSCPEASEVGSTLVGAGVGGALTYVPGKVYLAGPYNGSALSIVAVTVAKAGPFDLGTVVIREALKINPETAEVFIDATGSDPIPHIIQGIPVHARDIRVYVDRPDFVLNPTSCEPTSTASTVLGSGLNFASEADDVPVTVSTRFQAADCASLGFKPKHTFTLLGGTRRGDHPALHASVRPRPGDANLAKAVITLPHSEFLDQSHIRTVCTRVQFNAGAGNGAQCPAGAIYGHVVAYTPLLSDPLEGNVYLRSSEHPLPDLVFALHGLIDIDAVGRIDSVQKKGTEISRIRASFESIPDAPLSKVVLSMQGGNKGLLENSTNLCKGKHRVTAAFTGQNGKKYNFEPVLKSQCPKKGKESKRLARLVPRGW